MNVPETKPTAESGVVTFYDRSKLHTYIYVICILHDEKNIQSLILLICQIIFFYITFQ